VKDVIEDPNIEVDDYDNNKYEEEMDKEPSVKVIEEDKNDE